MKNLKINNKSIIIFVVIGFVFISSCSKNKPGIMDDSLYKGSLMFHIHSYIDGQEVEDYGAEYSTKEGRRISLTIAQLYISGIQLVKLDGSIYEVGNAKFLKVLENEIYMIENIPVGNYKSIRFKVGLDSTTNSFEPFIPSDSSILNQSSMWFSNVVQPDGYVFINVQGIIDTSSNFTMETAPFIYKIGTNSNLVSINMPEKHLTINKNRTSYSHLGVDYSKLFNGIQLNQQNNLTVSTAIENSSPIATLIKNNIPLMFFFE